MPRDEQRGGGGGSVIGTVPGGAGGRSCNGRRGNHTVGHVSLLVRVVVVLVLVVVFGLVCLVGFVGLLLLLGERAGPERRGLNAAVDDLGVRPDNRIDPGRDGREARDVQEGREWRVGEDRGRACPDPPEPD